MRHAQRQLALVEQVEQHAAVLFTREDKVDLGLHAVRTAGQIVFDRRPEIGKARHGVVEIGDGLQQIVDRIIRQHLLEFAERLARLAADIGIVGQIIGDGVDDEIDHTPRAAALVGVIRLAVFGVVDLERFALGIAARFDHFFLQKFRDADVVFHQRFGIGEHMGVDLL